MAALSEKFKLALVYAFDLHRGQYRKKTEVPYITHLMATAGIVLEHGGDETEAVAALLHDAVEDQGGLKTAEEIRRLFGNQVAEIVVACSDSTTKPKPSWKKRKEKYLAHLPQASPSVLLVSAADKLHNARSILDGHREIGDGIWKRFKPKKEQVLWYYRSLVEAYQRAINDNGHDPGLIIKLGPLVDKLNRVVSAMEKL